MEDTTKKGNAQGRKNTRIGTPRLLKKVNDDDIVNFDQSPLRYDQNKKCKIYKFQCPKLMIRSDPF